MAVVLSVLLGISLSAASGFRVFVPFLVISIASKAGFVKLSEGFSWMGSTPALILFAVATLVEIVAYYVPYIDNLLDMIALPVAVIAGTILTATVITDMSPMLKWSLALIAGGGASGLVHSGISVVRGASTATTGGLANNVVATIENVISTLISVFAILAPILAIIFISVLVFFIVRFIKNRKQKFKIS